MMDNDELLQLARKHPPPDSWWDEGNDPFTPVSPIRASWIGPPIQIEPSGLVVSDSPGAAFDFLNLIGAECDILVRQPITEAP